MGLMGGSMGASGKSAPAIALHAAYAQLRVKLAGHQRDIELRPAAGQLDQPDGVVVEPSAAVFLRPLYRSACAAGWKP